MKMVKMFDSNEIYKATGIDVLDVYNGNFCNDVAIPWWVGDEEDENCEKIDSYLLANGAVLGDNVWIDITW